MIHSRRAALLLTALLMIGCAETSPPPAEAPDASSTPPLVTDGAYAEYSTKRVFDAPLEPLRRWIEAENRIVAAMDETDRIKKPVDVTVISGNWAEVGSVRRLKFSDGHFVLERVLVNDFPNIFRYQVWHYTNDAGKNLEYAIGQQSWRTLDDGQSELTWTYKLKPNAEYKRFFVQRFVDSDMRPLMDNALDKVQALAAAEFGTPLSGAGIPMNSESSRSKL